MNWHELSFSLCHQELLDPEQIGERHSLCRSRADLPSRTGKTCAGELELAAGGSSLEVLLEVPAAQIWG